jgi:Meckel syndrome type 1 protein
MIVTCTNCQAKFRIADEKVGPKGVKVRCSKCQNVFPVRRETQGPAPASTVPPPLPRGAKSGPSLDLDLEAGRAPARAAAFAAQELAAGAPDPFAAPSDGAASADPFASAPAAMPGAFGRDADPFTAPAGRQDPFAGPSASEPFGGPAARPPEPEGALAPPPATDLSDLLASGATPAPDAHAGASPFAEGGLADTAFGSAEGEGLSLEDRTTPRPVPARADLFGSMEPFAAGGDLGGPEADEAAASLAAAGVAFQFPSAAEPQEDAPAAAAPARPVPRAAAPAPPPPPEPEDAAAVAERMRRRRGARLRSIAVNAVSLAVLLLAALALAVMWRRDAPLDPRSLRPSALLGALSQTEAASIATVDVTNGLYERARGAPLLFVRGRVVSRAQAPVHAVRVVVEVVRGAKVVARGEALAGAVPSPEELWSTEDAASLQVLARSLSARAASPVRPGEAVPFLVALAEYPVDLSGASLRVSAAPEAPPAQGAR